VSGPGFFATGSGWHFYVLDAERSGGDWIYRGSMDGAPFTVKPPIAGSAVSGGWTKATVGVNDASLVDEVAMWKDADLFTTKELQNLHDLADTFGLGLDQYGDQYEAPICWQATAVLPDGTVWRDSGCGPCPAVIRVPRGATDIVVTRGPPSLPQGGRGLAPVKGGPPPAVAMSRSIRDGFRRAVSARTQPLPRPATLRTIVRTFGEKPMISPLLRLVTGVASLLAARPRRQAAEPHVPECEDCRHWSSKGCAISCWLACRRIREAHCSQ